MLPAPSGSVTAETCVPFQPTSWTVQLSTGTGTAPVSDVHVDRSVASATGVPPTDMPLSQTPGLVRPRRP